MSVSEFTHLKELESENRSLKRIYAELSLVYHTIKDVMERKAVTPDVKREMARRAYHKTKKSPFASAVWQR